MHQMNEEMNRCIEACLHCYQTCRHEAMNHCLEAGGKHLEPTHFRLMTSCAEMCRTSADFMLTGSPLHVRTCAVFAEVFDSCAQSCEEVGDMDECVEACRRCAESCRSMAGTGRGELSMQGTQHQSAQKAPM
jgi:hypothetical protein